MMGRPKRAAQAGFIEHVLNRANSRLMRFAYAQAHAFLSCEIRQGYETNLESTGSLAVRTRNGTERPRLWFWWFLSCGCSRIGNDGCRFFCVTSQDDVKDRSQEQTKQGHAQHAAEDGGSEYPPHFKARTGGDQQGNYAQDE